MIYSVERALRSSKTSNEIQPFVWRKKQVICNFNKCSFCAMAGPETWLKFFIDIIFLQKEHNWADTTFSNIST